jgi:hypothetical protein
MALGRKTGGGSRKGRPNRRTLARERAVAGAAAKITTVLGANMFEGDAHALLMVIYKDPAQPIETRIEAAKAAIGYEKPRLAAVQASVGVGATLEELVMGAMNIRKSKDDDGGR